MTTTRASVVVSEKMSPGVFYSSSGIDQGGQRDLGVPEPLFHHGQQSREIITLLCRALLSRILGFIEGVIETRITRSGCSIAAGDRHGNIATLARNFRKIDRHFRSRTRYVAFIEQKTPSVS